MGNVNCLRLALLMLLVAATATRAENDWAEAAMQRTPFAAIAAFSPDGKSLATGQGWVDSPGLVRLSDLVTGKERLLCKDHADAVIAVAFTLDGKTLASGDWKGVVKLWDTATGRDLATLVGHRENVRYLAFSPDGKLLASSSASRVTLWDVTTAKERAVLPWHGDHFVAFSCVAFSPDGRTLAYGAADGNVTLWNVVTGKERVVCRGHSKLVVTATFAPDGKILATASQDSTVRLWNVATGRLQATLSGHKDVPTSLAYSPDGRMLASACCWSRNGFRESGATRAVSKGVEGSEVKLWEVTTLKERLTFEHGETGTSFMPMCFLHFSSDGKSLMATVNHPGADVKHWDLAKLAMNSK
jgi:WD40 repeat protein